MQELYHGSNVLVPAHMGVCRPNFVSYTEVFAAARFQKGDSRMIPPITQANVRSLDELREHADVASIAAYYESGKLQRWLMANYCEDEAEKISAVQEDERKANSGAETAALKAVVDALGLHTISEQNIENFFPRIAHLIVHNEKSIKTNWHKIVTLQKASFPQSSFRWRIFKSRLPFHCNRCRMSG